MHQPVLMYQSLSALHLLQVTACQHTQRMNAFAAVMGDTMAMWPVAKLLWTLVHFGDPVLSLRE